MYAVKVSVKEAETVKHSLLSSQNLSSKYRVVVKGGFVYFPIVSKTKIPATYLVVRVSLPHKEQRSLTLKENVFRFLTQTEREHFTAAFDQIGTIAILEIDAGLRKKEKQIAKALLEINPSIKTVLCKAGEHEGIFRTQRLKFLAGVDTRETMHRENGVQLGIDVEKVYFSPRLSNERKRVFQQVKKGESILVMFSGSGIYPVVISKNTKAKRIVGIEINPLAHSYALKNIKLNKIKNVEFIGGDVREVIPKLHEKFDRIIMPLPKSAENFLDLAFAAAKKGAIIHFYDFLHEDHFADAQEKIKNVCALAKRKCAIKKLVKCGQYSPHVFRICVDFVVL